MMENDQQEQQDPKSRRLVPLVKRPDRRWFDGHDGATLLTRKETAAALGVSPRTLTRMVNSKEINAPILKRGRHHWPIRYVHEWLNERFALLCAPGNTATSCGSKNGLRPAIVRRLSYWAA
jgi:AraC-like DNA-binding protein